MLSYLFVYRCIDVRFPIFTLSFVHSRRCLLVRMSAYTLMRPYVYMCFEFVPFSIYESLFLSAHHVSIYKRADRLVYRFVRKPFGPPVCLLARLYVCPFIWVFRPNASLRITHFADISIRPYVYPFVCPSALCVSVSLYVCPSICLFAYLFVRTSVLRGVCVAVFTTLWMNYLSNELFIQYIYNFVLNDKCSNADFVTN